MFILASSVCKSLQCLTCALTQGGEGGHLFVQLCCGEGGTLQTSITGVCGECSQCMDHTGFATAQGGMCSPGLPCQAPGYPARALIQMGPVFHAHPRSKPLRFSGTPQGHRPGRACVLCPSQVQVAQATRCLASALSQVGCAS